MNNFNFTGIIQVLFFVLVFVGPAIGAVVRKVRAHAEEKRIEVEREKRRIESIRTGRVTEQVSQQRQEQAAPQTKSDAAEAIRRQRQEQIAELRRRYQAQQAQQQARQQAARQAGGQRAGQASAGPTSSQSARTPLPSGRKAQSGSAPARPPSREAELERLRREGRHDREAGERKNRKAPGEVVGQPNRAPAKPKRRRPAQKPVQTHTDHAEPVHAAEYHPVYSSRPQYAKDSPNTAPVIATLRNPAEIRRAIIINEILGKPVSMRAPDASG